MFAHVSREPVRADVAVVGAGAIGLAIAWRLSQQRRQGYSQAESKMDAPQLQAPAQPFPQITHISQ